MFQRVFAEKFCRHFSHHPNVLGIAAAGSWITSEMDEFSDLDLTIVTREKTGGNKEKMLDFARQMEGFVSGFTGDHVGEPRLLICLYDPPLLHADLKFVTPEEFETRIENPVVLFEKDHLLTNIIQQTDGMYPPLDFQWLEDRFWTWIHYALLKTGRGEYMEAFDFFSFLRLSVFGPLLLIKNGQLPRAVRKVETLLPAKDFEKLRLTIPTYTLGSLLECLQHSVKLYKELRQELFTDKIQYQKSAEEKVMLYFQQLESSLINKQN